MSTKSPGKPAAARSDEDRAPDLPPYRIVLEWTVGDSLVIDGGLLDDWEVRAALEKAVEVLREAEYEDTEEEEG